MSPNDFDAFVQEMRDHPPPGVTPAQLDAELSWGRGEALTTDYIGRIERQLPKPLSEMTSTELWNNFDDMRRDPQRYGLDPAQIGAGMDARDLAFWRATHAINDQHQTVPHPLGANERPEFDARDAMNKFFGGFGMIDWDQQDDPGASPPEPLFPTPIGEHEVSHPPLDQAPSPDDAAVDQLFGGTELDDPPATGHAPTLDDVNRLWPEGPGDDDTFRLPEDAAPAAPASPAPVAPAAPPPDHSFAPQAPDPVPVQEAVETGGLPDGDTNDLAAADPMGGGDGGSGGC
ncbi:MAG TPA: hypothetical protein VIH82_10750 [Acidimicrobiia bacterium]